jgi:DNA repair protein RecN (Recombination protein N)
MIKSLQIHNYAIIEALEISFSQGLTIITGETGAGKSILLGALGLVMGKRADIKSLYNLAEKCVIEGHFDISSYDLRPFFEAKDLDYEEQLVIRREITPAGKSRAFVNDTPTTLDVLQELSSTLIDLHQQFDNLDIHQVSFQLRLLDALADNKMLLADYQARYARYQDARRRLAELQRRNERAARELDFLNFQLEEFSAASLRAGEQEELEEELNRLTNAEDIKRSLAAAFQQLSENELSVMAQIGLINQSLSQVRRFDPRIEQLYERLGTVMEEFKDLAQTCERIAEATEYDPERITEAQQRLDLIYRLQKKHQVATVAELLDIQAKLQQQLDAISDLSTEIASLETEVQLQEQALYALAETLSDRRHAVVGGFENQVENMLAQLAMEHARLKAEFKRLDQLGPTGIDEVNFLFAANKGSRMQLIKDVASGGELSRLTLVVKSLVASAIPLPTLIFDEIDTGISGDVALKMGNILQQLAGHHQVVTITHSPQVACKGQAHYFVYKQVRQDRTYAEVRHLSGEERVMAIATMLSQNPPSAAAIENAKQLLNA